MQDPDEAVAELSERGVVANAAGADGVVVGAGPGEQVRAELDRLDEALAAHQAALAHYEREDGERGRGLSLISMGRVLHLLDRGEEALAAFSSRVEFSLAVSHYNPVVLACNTMGRILQQQCRFTRTR